MNDHKALPIAATIGDGRGGFYFAKCQVCNQAIWLNQNKKEGWKHDER